MTFLSDSMILSTYKEHLRKTGKHMIDPFFLDQVKQHPNGPQGSVKVISYGLSSGGYDIRVADEYQIFQPKPGHAGRAVDPKNFDPDLVTHYKGDVCEVPGHSYVLCHSMEHFDIPRHIMVTCLGKSTYARCFSGATRVALVNGSSASLEDMARRSEGGEPFFGYAVGPYGGIIVALLDRPRLIGRDCLLEVTLDNGQTIECTPDHEFLLRNGGTQMAGDLRLGTSLFPLYRKMVRGYETVYQPLTGHLTATHKLSDAWNVRNNIYPDVPGTHRHHIDHNRSNNVPWNIERVLTADHIRHHNSIFYGPGFDAEGHGDSIKEAFKRLSRDPAWLAIFKHKQQERARMFWDDPHYGEVREKLRQYRSDLWTPERKKAKGDEVRERYAAPEGRKRHGDRMREAWSGDSARREAQAEIARGINLRPDITAEAVREALDKEGSLRGAARALHCDRSVFRRFPEVIAAFRGTPGRNHKIVGIRQLPGNHDVYCLTVPEAGNFALESGVFVKNCGLHVNVTPLEPEWCGQLTIEISNASPCPVKIYSGEGIAQLVFGVLTGDVMVSYADRGGKYMRQHGIVLPRMSQLA